MALLLGYGAGAINPYLAFETIDDLIDEGVLPGLSKRQAMRNYIKACGKGVLKVMSKMGISTVASYTGAQVFEAIGLGQELVDEYFTGTTSQLGGVGLDVLADGGRGPPPLRVPRPPGRGRAPRRCGTAASTSGAARASTTSSTPRRCSSCSTRRARSATRSSRSTRAWSTSSRASSRRCAACSGSSDGERPPVPIDEVEPVSEIVKRFSTGAMSYGSISTEAHETLAIAMNRIGGKSNTGEGGEDADRFAPDDERRPAPHRDQAGGVRPLRRDDRVPHQRRRPADQDGAGREAGRGRPAARAEGVPVDREDAALDAGRRPDHPAAAPRHLLDRGSQAAHPRPEELEPVGARAREARGRGRRRHGRRRRVEGERRRRAHLRPRRRHRRRRRSRR